MNENSNDQSAHARGWAKRRAKYGARGCSQFAGEPIPEVSNKPERYRTRAQLVKDLEAMTQRALAAEAQVETGNQDAHGTSGSVPSEAP